MVASTTVGAWMARRSRRPQMAHRALAEIGLLAALALAASGCGSELQLTGSAASGGAGGPLAAVCGDGLWQPDDGTELCDDGNTTGGDGCSATCQVEDGWECDTALDLRTGTPMAGAPEAEARWRFPDLLPELPPLLHAADRCADQPFAASDLPVSTECEYIRRADCQPGVVATFTFNLAAVPPRSRVFVAGRFSLARAPADAAGATAEERRAAARAAALDTPALWGVGTLKLYGDIDVDRGSDTVVDVTAVLRPGLNHVQIQQPLALALRVCQPDGTGAMAKQASRCQRRCSNGAVDPGETCDDGNSAAGDGCGVDCALEAGFCWLNGAPAADGGWCSAGGFGACGDGVVECTESGVGTCHGKAPTEEACNGADDDCDGETDELAGGPCTVEGALGPCAVGVSTCVEGALTCMGPTPTDETCNGLDDNCNGLPDDVPPDPCELTPETDPGCGVARLRCEGDAVVCEATPAEEVCNGRDDNCDGLVDEDCDKPCGNGQLDDGEECDGTPECTPECHIGFCGDAFVTEGEDCDAGPGGDGEGACTAECQAITCGDGVVYPGVEACDDGSPEGDDDGCLACVVSSGWTCEAALGAASTCAPTCGDNKAVGGEGCDDGGKEGGDGCSATCAEETGFTCSTSLLGVNVCEPDCGDLLVVAGEGCDDGDIAAGDGCSPVCQVEPEWTCSDSAGGSVCMRRCDAPNADVCPAGRGCDTATGLCVTL